MAEYNGLLTPLQAPFPASAVQWRVAREIQGGRAVQVLAYLDARAVEERLDDVFGPFGWQTEVTMEGGTIACTLSVWDEAAKRWIRKTNVSEGTDIEAAKGGYSTAFKRAAASGLGIGRYLYRMGETTAPLMETPMKGSHWHKRKADDKSTYWMPPQLPSWALPKGEEPVAAEPILNDDVPDSYEPPAMPEMREPAKPAPVERKCPKCGGPMWDNRFDKRNPRQPDFKCKNKDCDHPVWLTPRSGARH